jgi:hypothetical protein
MVRKKDKAGRYVVETKQREDKVGEGGVRDPLRNASGPQPIAASDRSPDRYHFPNIYRLAILCWERYAILFNSGELCGIHGHTVSPQDPSPPSL